MSDSPIAPNCDLKKIVHVTDGADRWNSLSDVRLAANVIVATGADGRTLLRTPQGAYFAVPKSAEPLVEALREGGRADSLFAMLDVPPADLARARDRLATFLAELRDANVLNIPPLVDQASRRTRLVKRARAEFFTRLPFGRTAGGWLTRIGGRMRVLPSFFLSALVVIAASSGLVVALTFARVSITGVSIPVVSVAVAVLIVQLLAHEACHAIAMGYNGLRVREMGVGLVFFVTPVAYVDRSETYTLRSRAGRALIALAGPMSDAASAGVAALVSIAADGVVSDVFALVAVMQLYLLAANLNPLFRTDGYHALEALTGALNMRSRALTYVWSKVLRAPLPSYFESLSTARKVWYVAYLLVGVLYAALLIAAAVSGALFIAEGLWHSI